LLFDFFSFTPPTPLQSDKKSHSKSYGVGYYPHASQQKLNDNKLYIGNGFVFSKQLLRAYPNNRVVMRPSEKFEAKAAGQKCSEAWFSPR
jgi:hypothetical protein